MKLYRINKRTVVKIAPFQSKYNIDINVPIENKFYKVKEPLLKKIKVNWDKIGRR